jgi:hypothetical protein
MSTENNAAEVPLVLPVLGVNERRVLGVLVEKAKTTPDTYPLSINALVTGCNQKSNREPLLDLNQDEAEEALTGVQQKGLAIKITGGRVTRWRHNLYEAWHLGKVELAVIAELLLRGPQTEGELRGRASRMEAIADLDSLRALLRPLADRRLVSYLSPEGRRGTVLTHGFHAADEWERLRTAHKTEAFSSEAEERPSDRGSAPAEAARAVPAARATNHEASPALEARLAQACAEIGNLRQLVAALEQRVQAMEVVHHELARFLQPVCDALPAGGSSAGRVM